MAAITGRPESSQPKSSSENLPLEKAAIHPHRSGALKADGSEDRKSPEDGGKDERGEIAGFLPGDVSRRIFGADTSGIASFQGERTKITKAQKQIIATSGILPVTGTGAHRRPQTQLQKDGIRHPPHRPGSIGSLT